jgi:hypothetical protein
MFRLLVSEDNHLSANYKQEMHVSAMLIARTE